MNMGAQEPDEPVLELPPVDSVDAVQESVLDDSHPILDVPVIASVVSEPVIAETVTDSLPISDAVETVEVSAPVDPVPDPVPEPVPEPVAAVELRKFKAFFRHCWMPFSELEVQACDENAARKWIKANYPGDYEVTLTEKS